jgi:AraC-like DNA-binding protein
MDQESKVSVLISRHGSRAWAGIVSSLRDLPECDVHLWDDDLQGQYGSPEAVAADIVPRELEPFPDWTDRAEASGSQVRSTNPIAAADERATSERLVVQISLANSLSVQRLQQEIIDAVRNLIGTVRNAESHRARPPRGGMTRLSLRRIREHIDDHIAARVSLRELAGIAALSVGHFCRAFKQSAGMSPHRYLRHRRIETAEGLIRDTTLSLAEIAQRVGFSDQSHFTRVFAQARGETPAAFRRRHR